MLFIGQWLLLMGVWGVAAMVADIEARVLQCAGAALAQLGLLSLVSALLLGDARHELESAGWLGVAALQAIYAAVSFVVGLAIAKLAFEVDLRQACAMALTSALGCVATLLFWRWAAS